MNIVIREWKEGEQALLEDFLYEAIFIPEGVEAPPREIIQLPELQVYITEFGEKPDDICFLAEADGKVAGAVWVRVMEDYGHLEDGVPSFAISLYKEYRGLGIGTALMKRMLCELKERGYEKASLAVQKENFAVKMYQKVGFEIVGETEEEYLMMWKRNEHMEQKLRFFEELSFNSHPSLQTKYYDGWLLRFSEGYTNRANSVNMIYPSTIDLQVKIEECEAQYFKQGLPCVFKMTDGSETGLDVLLQERGYEVATPTDLMTLDLRDKTFETGECIIANQVTKEWLDTYFKLENYPPKKCETATKMLEMIRNETLYCCIEKNGESIACASAVLERGYVTLVNVIVDERYRGQGYGRRLCESLLSQAKETGSHTAYLQVVQSNRIAVKLYESLGYRKEYSYWYRVKKEDNNKIIK